MKKRGRGKPFKSTHGMSRSREYAAWQAMKYRCLDPIHDSYKNYGARGISVDVRWLDFNLFILDMGLKPSPIHQLERVDNNGDYTKINCIWALPIINMNNRRNTKYLNYNGITQSISQWAKQYNLKRNVLWNRLYRYNWSIEKSLGLLN